MKIITMLGAVIATCSLLNADLATARDDQPMLYVSVDCMKSTSPGYVSTEVDIWQPIHEELIKRGSRNSWSLYEVTYGDRSRCDYYTVTTYVGEQQLNAGFPVAEVFAAVHEGEDMMAAMARTWAARQRVATELWATVDSTEIGKYRYAIVNKMYAKDPDAYRRIETQVFKPGHQALVDAGHRAGWAMYELIAPLGTSIRYNFGTVDFVNHLSPVPMAEAMLAAHPDRDLDSIQELLDVRDHVSSETWTLVATAVADSE